MKRKYGWKPSLPRPSKKYSLHHISLEQLPPSFDLRSQCPPVYDQGDLGSCTANGLAGCIQYLQPQFMPSRLFIYYNERVLEGDPQEDGGAEIYDGIKTITTQGCCSETDWPYDTTQYAIQPPANCYTDASKDLITDFFNLSVIEDFKQCLASGYPVVFGMTVFESFESAVVAQTGNVPIPTPGEQELGGHCMMLVGYDDVRQSFIFRNSWGNAWGLAGYGYIQYEYITQYASDFWTLKK